MPSAIRKWLLLASTTALVFPNVSLSQISTSSGPTFTARAELVTVPVIVTDHYGVYVHNLKKEDFVLLEDGKPQPIVSFEEFQAAPASTQQVSAQAAEFSNHPAEGASPTQITILVFDMLNTPLEDQSYARKELIRYLSGSSSTGSPTCLLAITRRGIKIVSDFTTDLKALTAALQNMPSERQLVEEASQEALPRTNPAAAAMLRRQRETDQQREASERHAAVLITLQVMQQIAQYCAGMPGRKAMIWATDGFPFSISEMEETIKLVGPRSDSLADVNEVYRATWKVLNDAQVAVYPIDAHGLENPTFVDVGISKPGPGFIAHNIWKNSETHGTFQQFAAATGGRAFFNTNDLANSFLAAADDNRSYYVLTYHLDRQDKKAGWHKLTVRLNRGEYHPRARSGFFLDPNGSPKSDKSDMELALSSPLNSTAIPIRGQWQKIEPAAQPGKRKVIFLLTMPADFARIEENDNNHFVVEFAAVARNQTGADVGETSKTMDGHLNPESVQEIRHSGMDYRGSLILPPGQYTVRFAVQDHLSGRTGSVSAPLDVQP